MAEAFYGYKIIIPQEEPKQETLEEAAEEYILMNKPCLSISDVLNVKLGNLDTLEKKLKQLLKTKL